MLLKIEREGPDESRRESLCLNYRLKREQRRPTPCATWEVNGVTGLGEGKGSG